MRDLVASRRDRHLFESQPMQPACVGFRFLPPLVCQMHGILSRNLADQMASLLWKRAQITNFRNARGPRGPLAYYYSN
jgi:hypothetical protein